MSNESDVNVNNTDGEIRLPLIDRMKHYESQHDIRIPTNRPFILRLDGHHFSKFTKSFPDVEVEPFNIYFIKAMALTASDLLKKYRPSTVYFHSDEFTMIFPTRCTLEKYFEKDEQNKPSHEFGGRVEKLNSLIASFCSVRFNKHIYEQVHNNETLEFSEQALKYIDERSQIFDCRVLTFDECNSKTIETEIVNHMIWRSQRDCERNAVATYAQQFYSSNELNKSHTNERIKMLAEKKIDWDKDVPLYLKNGIYCKNDLIDVEATDHHGCKVTAVRKITRFRSFKIKMTEEMYLMLAAKYWKEVDEYNEKASQENKIQFETFDVAKSNKN